LIDPGSIPTAMIGPALHGVADRLLAPPLVAGYAAPARLVFMVQKGRLCLRAPYGRIVGAAAVALSR
jgi:hypothetical protein